uniref:adenylate/guanylate cyclase domain-containing protein n=1 Tax=Falsiroseomonas oryzae TaxID=2766473 RepID=UPI0022EB3507
IAVAGAGAAVIAATAFAFDRGLLLPGVAALLGLVLAAAAGGWAVHGADIKERARLRRAFGSYLDPRIIDAMVEREQEPGFGGEQREVSVLFSDLAGFTATAEALPPAEVAALLNDYFDGLAAAVVAEGGLVANLIGDGMFALFGAPLPQPDHAARAVAAARRIDAFARDFEARHAARGVRLGATRIGVHTGVAMVGNLGTRARLQYGAIGDAVNLAQRLEGLNRETGTRIAVSAATARAAGGAFRPLGAFAVKGRLGEVEALTPEP